MPHLSECPCETDYHQAYIRSRVTVTDSGCWEWQGARDPRGYGMITHYKQQWKAHRYSFEAHKGHIAEGLTIDHLCGNQPCVNPEHLEQVPMGENARRYFARFAMDTGNEADSRHGTLNGYNRWKCRCERCTAANRDYQRGHARKRRAA